MNNTYILLGGDGYYGRNFQYYLAEKDKYFIIIDKNIPNDFYDEILIKTHILDYIYIDLNKNDCVKEIINKIEFFKDNVIIINFAAISFVDYSIVHPEETIINNLKCCINGYKLSIHFNNSIYIYISTDEVRVEKDDDDLSPYVISKRKCEKFLKSVLNDKIYIIRPVNLMDVIYPGIKGLKQKNKCLLTNITNSIINNKNVVLHSGNQKRMFMTVRNACKLLLNVSIFKYNIIDVVELPHLRTSDLKIHDIVYFLQYVYKYKIDIIDNPRGKYQDETYLNKNEEYNKNSLTMVLNAVNRMLN